MEVEHDGETPAEEEAWERVRAAYVEQQPLLNLNNAAVSPPPRVVEQAAIDAFRLVSQNPDRNMWSKLDTALPEIKAELAELIDCDPGEIALNRNSTEGLCTAIFGIPLTAGDRVVISHWDACTTRASAPPGCSARNARASRWSPPTSTSWTATTTSSRRTRRS
ncbi:hypothetical protein ABT063_46285 [Streptomyces sp. NPDC002838]|uniref:hypothetical protein n=1 Tax=Streptomyces sp. NPDC002838 TaxID=3154436 RepID=UPI00333258F0